jgi:hypothetical protein
MVTLSAHPVIERIVDRNRAMWAFLTAPENMPHAEKLALLEAWIPPAPSADSAARQGK